MKSIRVNFSGIGFWLAIIVGIIFLSSIGLGWLVKGTFQFLLILLLFVFIAPSLILLGVRWWFSRQLVQDSCPVCEYEFTGFRKYEFKCPSCGEPLKVQDGKFQRLTPPGTIDVDAVEVSARQIDSNS
ncbi:hypothetical protein [Geitlerinema sp. PCC 9228]|jgi:predicted RNA-binding Zn-ribbon protein involved in translation (DUF1610 family)|uniref:hypothetical protein n=1 Tax=Geitlerinema sp. PCC 9228 TaxID=111611 RepID=UPI000A4CB9C5|nr:hypothetical protein [Geitlerinema sp. PCC 9228]